MNKWIALGIVGIGIEFTLTVIWFGLMMALKVLGVCLVIAIIGAAIIYIVEKAINELDSER